MIKKAELKRQLELTKSTLAFQVDCTNRANDEVVQLKREVRTLNSRLKNSDMVAALAIWTALLLGVLLWAS